jgi:hypothetical protein
MASPHRRFYGGAPKEKGGPKAPPIPHGCDSCKECWVPDEEKYAYKLDGCEYWVLDPTYKDRKLDEQFEQAATDYEVVGGADEEVLPVQPAGDGVTRRVFLPHDVWEKISNFVGLVDIEISGFGRVFSDTEEVHYTEADLQETQPTVGAVYHAPRSWKVQYKNYYIEDVFILEQENSGGFTSQKEEALSKFLVDVVRKGGNPENYNFWWHSHVNMGTFWSGTDDATAIRLSQGNELISIVFNKRGEMRARWDCKGVTVDDIPVVVMQPKVSDIKAYCEKEIKEKVKERKWEPIKNWGRRWRKYGYGWDTTEEEGYDDWSHNTPTTVVPDYDYCKEQGHIWGTINTNICVVCDKSKEQIAKEEADNKCSEGGDHLWEYTGVGEEMVCTYCGKVKKGEAKKETKPNPDGICMGGGAHVWDYVTDECIICKKKKGQPIVANSPVVEVDDDDEGPYHYGD